MHVLFFFFLFFLGIVRIMVAYLHLAQHLIKNFNFLVASFDEYVHSFQFSENNSDSKISLNCLSFYISNMFPYRFAFTRRNAVFGKLEKRSGFICSHVPWISTNNRGAFIYHENNFGLRICADIFKPQPFRPFNFSG